MDSALKWLQEIRKWVENEKTAQGIQQTSIAVSSLRESVRALNAELKELNAASKKSNRFLKQIANIQHSVDKQSNTMLALTIVLVLFGALQLYLTWTK